MSKDMQTTWADMVAKYEAMFAEDSELSNVDTMLVTAYAEPEAVTSMARNIGFHTDPDFEPTEKKPFEIVYKVIIVIRDNPLLLEQATDSEGIDAYHRTIYGAAKERVRLWYAAAIATYMGLTFDDIDFNDPRMGGIKPTIALPRKTGSPTITVFGDVVDSDGRTHNMTVTDQTRPEHVLNRIQYATWLWDEVTKIGHEVDMNQWGKMPYRGVSKGKKSTTSRGRSPKKTTTVTKPAQKPTAKADDKPAKKNGDSPQKPSPIKGLPKPSKKNDNSDSKPQRRRIMPRSRPTSPSTGLKICDTFAEVRDIDPQITFQMRVAKISRAPTRTEDSTLNFYSYSESSDGSQDVDGSDSVWLYSNYSEHDELMAEILQHYPEFGDGDKAEIETTDEDIIIQATKSVNQTKKTAYYRNIKLVRWG